MTPYTVFYKENYASFANRLGITTAKVLAPEIGKAWRALSKEEKDVYLEKAREITRERVERGDAPTSEKILPNEIQYGNNVNVTGLLDTPLAPVPLRNSEL